VGAACFAVVFLLFIGNQTYVSARSYRLVERNFYGVLRVFGVSNLRTGEYQRVLQHGFIRHGVQVLKPEERRRDPISYFGPFSGIGLTFYHLRDEPNLKVGILGMGIGTLAAYARPGDLFRFYEIDPLVVDIAQREFTYLEDSPGQLEVVLGDGRLSLEREPPQQYDVLVMDAFSGDSIPVHLITKEAFELYFRHLKPDGILAVNVSNRYLRPELVVERIAAALGKPARIVRSSDRPEEALTEAHWVLLTDRPGFYEAEMMKIAARPLPTREGMSVWTDNFSNLLKILR
jgi:SAM-dependent methyltransferase